MDVESCRVRDICRRPAPSPLPSDEPLICESDADDFVSGVRLIIAQLLPTARPCAGVLLCGQMGGLVLSSPNGEALRPYISWMDGRATGRHPSRNLSYFEVLAEIVGNRSETLLGNEFRPGLPYSFLFHLQQTGQLDHHRGAIPVTLPDYVAAALCQARPVMEWTSAAGLLDITGRSFPGTLIADLQLNGLQWPELVDFRHRVGDFRTDGHSLPVYAATGDHQCSLAGTLLRDSELSINVATGSQVSMLSVEATTGDYQLRPYFDGLWLKTITNIPAGRALTAIVKLLTEISRESCAADAGWDYFFRKAEETAVSDIDINLAFFPGAVTGPGHLRKLTEDNLTVGHIARASLEHMACCYDQFGRRISSDAAWTRLVFSGGIAQKSTLLRRLIAEKMNSAFRSAGISEDALYGMVVLGRVIAGLNRTVAESSESVRQLAEQDGQPD